MVHNIVATILKLTPRPADKKLSLDETLFVFSLLDAEVDVRLVADAARQTARHSLSSAPLEASQPSSAARVVVAVALTHAQQQRLQRPVTVGVSANVQERGG